jgi:hypothetical protein
VLDGVGVIQACFCKWLLKMVLRRLYLTLDVAHGLCGMFSAGATCPIVDAAIDVGCGLLVALFTPLLVSLGALLRTLDDNAGWPFPTADRGWLKSLHPGTGDVMGGDATPSFGGDLGVSINVWRDREVLHHVCGF